MNRLEDLVIAAESKRLRIGQSLLELTGEFVLSHRVEPAKGVSGCPGIGGKAGGVQESLWRQPNDFARPATTGASATQAMTVRACTY